ncbi:hypothetical protein FTH31_23615 [Salmonella enterica]|nr:hypothetical protein [Salmonella enterica]
MSKILMKSGRHNKLPDAIEAVKKPSLPTKKLQMNIPENIHKEFKLACLREDKEMTEVVLSLINHWLESEKNK